MRTVALFSFSMVAHARKSPYGLRRASGTKFCCTQQVSTPRDVFDNHKNLFTAGFIGAHRMNALKATLTRNGTRSISLSYGSTLHFNFASKVMHLFEPKAEERLLF